MTTGRFDPARTHQVHPSGGRARLNHQGTTLVELFASLLFVSIISAMTYSFARSAFMSARVQEVKSEAQEVTVVALDMMRRELRMAGFTAAATPLAGVRIAARDRVEVVADLNGDGSLADSNEIIAYSYDERGQQLMRATGGTSPQPLVRNVTALAFAFFDADGAELVPPPSGLAAPDCGRIRRIDVTLSVEFPNPDPLVRRPLTSTVATSVQLRNP